MQIARKLVSGIFTYDNMLDTSAVFVRLLQSPEIRELALVGGHRDNRKKYWETLESIAENIKGYLTVILQTKGPRTTINQQAFRTILAACSGPNLAQQRNMREAGDVLVRMHCWYNMLMNCLYILHVHVIHREFTIAI